MAVLGFQLVLTIVVLSVLNKLSAKYSFARWLLTKGGLIRYLHPSNDHLKEAINAENSAAAAATANTKSGNQKDSGKASTARTYDTRSSRRRRHQAEDDKRETFNVPRNLTLTLVAEPISVFDLLPLPYYSDLQWLIDFSFCTVLVYFATELYYTVLPGKVAEEYNLSLVWCLLSLAFTAKILLTITWVYFRGGAEAMPERSMCITFGCLYFLISMIVLIPNEDLLEFGLVDSYAAFSENARKLIESHNATDNAYGPASFLMFRFWLATICGLIGMCFTWPGLRIAKMHKDALQYAEGNRLLIGLYNLSFISPLFIILFWFKPIARNYFTVREWPNTGIIMTTESFEATRLLFILAVLVLRFGLFRRYLQSYLNIAPQKLHYLNKESGKITNVDMQKLIARVGYYLCVASLQYLAPILLTLFLTLLTKSSGGYQWTPGQLFGGSTNLTSNLTSTFESSSVEQLMSTFESSQESVQMINATEVLNATTATLLDEPLLEQEFVDQNLLDADELLENVTQVVSNATEAASESIQETAKVTLMLMRDVFNSTVLRGLTGFLLWWTVTVWFSSATIGFVYHSYFET